MRRTCSATCSGGDRTQHGLSDGQGDPAEANRATEIARSVSGVQRVVRVLEIVTEAELKPPPRPQPPRHLPRRVLIRSTDADRPQCGSVGTIHPVAAPGRQDFFLRLRRFPIRLDVSQRCRPSAGCRRRTGRPGPSPAGAHRCGGFLVEHQIQVLRIQSTAKPKSNWSATMVLPRLSSCQLWAAPLPITSSTWFMSSPAFCAKAMASLRPCAGRRCRSG